MLRRTLSAAGCLVALATGLSACAPSPPSAAATPPPASVPGIPTPVPTATPLPVSSGPLAVVVSNSDRVGSTYQIMLIDADAQIVAQATAQLPTPQPNETLALPLVGVSDSTVYYLDGNTTVEALTPTGTTSRATTIPSGAAEEVAFAVSPDDQQIAIGEITEAPNAGGDTGVGYVETLQTGANVVSLWKDNGPSALRWPAGWNGSLLVNAVVGSSSCGFGSCYGPGPGEEALPTSYHVVNTTYGGVIANVCETPASQPAWGTPKTTVTSDGPQGLPTAAGTACVESAASFDQSGRYAGATETVEAVNWSGNAVVFTQYTEGAGMDLDGCYLSPDGSRMACTSSSDGTLTLLSSSGTRTDTGTPYGGILGWIDDTHLLVEIDAGYLGVVDPDSGSLTAVAVDQPNLAMVATLPGQL